MSESNSMTPTSSHGAQEGYLDAFDMLVDRHSAMVYRVALRMLGNREDAQDLAQEALLAAWRNLDRFRGEALFSYLAVSHRHPTGPEQAHSRTGAPIP